MAKRTRKKSSVLPTRSGATARAIVAAKKRESESAGAPWSVVCLPKPPSVNAMFRNAGYGKDSKRGGRIKTARYLDWRTEARAHFYPLGPYKIQGAYELRIELGRRKGSDLDNYAKGISDLLVWLGIVPDDSLCERIALSWADELASNQCRIAFRAFSQEVALAR